MKNLFTNFFCGAIIFLLFTMLTEAQNMDTIDVAPGYETLNIAINGDTTSTGDPAHPNAVYRLQRGRIYVLNGSITGVKDETVRIVAAEGDGARPILISAVQDNGATLRAFDFNASAYLKDLYVSQINTAGIKFKKNTIVLEGNGADLVVDGCFLENEAQAFVRSYGLGVNVKFTNTIMRNSQTYADPDEGSIMRFDGGVDSLYLQNCTVYRGTFTILDDRGKGINNAFIDHNTFYELSGQPKDGGAPGFTFGDADTMVITNNLFYNIGWAGGLISPPDTTTSRAMISVDSTDNNAQRQINISNNVYGWTTDDYTWITSKSDIALFHFINASTDTLLAKYPNMVDTANIEAHLTFSGAPNDSIILAYAQQRYNSNYSNTGLPDIGAQMLPQTDDTTTWGTAPANNYNEYTFDYGTAAAAYTHSEGGYPVGDLNWYPDKLKEWEGGATAIRQENNQMPSSFYLSQNYPNPFNPTTVINYSIAKAGLVTLKVYNILGQEVATLVNREQATGTYKVSFDASNMASGVYVYRLTSSNFSLTKKMTLIK